MVLSSGWSVGLPQDAGNVTWSNFYEGRVIPELEAKRGRSGRSGDGTSFRKAPSYNLRKRHDAQPRTFERGSMVEPSLQPPLVISEAETDAGPSSIQTRGGT